MTWKSQYRFYCLDCGKEELVSADDRATAHNRLLRDFGWSTRIWYNFRAKGHQPVDICGTCAREYRRHCGATA
jgi:hypothetical protein